MNQVPIRLGPLALLLTVISICLTTLSILTFTTAGADLRLAQKYADTVRLRYELEARGQSFLREAQDAAAMGLPLDVIIDASPVPGGGVTKTFEEDGTVLTVELSPGTPGTDRAVEVDEWKIIRNWDEDGSIGNIWMPQ